MPTEPSQTWQLSQTSRPVRLLPTRNAQRPILLRPTQRAHTTARTRFGAAPRPLLLLRPHLVPIPPRKWQATHRQRRRRLQVTPRPRRLLILLRRPRPRQRNPRQPRPRLSPLSQRPKYPARRHLLEPWPGRNPSRCRMLRWGSSLRRHRRLILRSRNSWRHPSLRDIRKRQRMPAWLQVRLHRSTGQHRSQRGGGRGPWGDRRQCPELSSQILAF